MIRRGVSRPPAPGPVSAGRKAAAARRPPNPPAGGTEAPPFPDVANSEQTQQSRTSAKLNSSLVSNGLKSAFSRAASASRAFLGQEAKPNDPTKVRTHLITNPRIEGTSDGDR